MQQTRGHNLPEVLKLQKGNLLSTLLVQWHGYLNSPLSSSFQQNPDSQLLWDRVCLEYFMLLTSSDFSTVGERTYIFAFFLKKIYWHVCLLILFKISSFQLCLSWCLTVPRVYYIMLDYASLNVFFLDNPLHWTLRPCCRNPWTLTELVNKTTFWETPLVYEVKIPLFWILHIIMLSPLLPLNSPVAGGGDSVEESWSLFSTHSFLLDVCLTLRLVSDS